MKRFSRQPGRKSIFGFFGGRRAAGVWRQGSLLPIFLLLFFMHTPVCGDSEATGETRRELSPEQTARVLERLATVQEQVRSLQADFVEKRTIADLQRPLRFQGKLYYRKPSFFFMEYFQPVHHILRVRENQALIFVKGSRTADLVDLSSLDGAAGRMYLFAPDPRGFSGELLQDDSFYYLQKRAESQEPDAVERDLLVALDKKTLLVRMIRSRGEFGDVTRIRLDNVKTNLELPPEVLSFEPPEGVRINRLDSPSTE